MKVQVPTSSLANALSHVERIVPTRSSNPGLNLVRIDLLGDALRFSGTNLDLDVETTVSADVRGDGTLALPAQVFAQVVRALPGDVVDLAVEEGQNELQIASGSYATRLQLVDPDATQALTFHDDYEGRLSARGLAKALGSVRYAAAVAEYQAIFRGVKIEASDQGTRAVATDGFRLAYYDLDERSGLDGAWIVPSKSADEVVRLLGDGDVDIAVAEGQLSLRTEQARINVKLMDGTFPDYRRVIPSTFPITITLRADALYDVAQRVAVMADKTANNRVDLFVKDGVLQITAEGAYGRSQEAVEVQQEGSDGEMALAYNAKYLTDALAPLEGELRMRFSGPTTPSLLNDPSDPAYLAMVVPLRTG
ncbi:MAG: DNA polymerase III subunit beta [Trueperaceae bacterium]